MAAIMKPANRQMALTGTITKARCEALRPLVTNNACVSSSSVHAENSAP